MPRTPPDQWGALFNFAGAGIIHIELFEELLALVPGPTLLEWIAGEILLSGTTAAKPAANSVPIGTVYYDTTLHTLSQSDGTNWLAWPITGDAAIQSGAPGARVYNSAAISLPDSTVTALTFDTERFDTGDLHSTSSNTSRLTLSTAGVYFFSGHTVYAGNATGERVTAIRLNGANNIVQQNDSTTSAGNRRVNVATLWKCAANDYVELTAYQNSGGSLNVNRSADFTPEFCGQLLTK